VIEMTEPTEPGGTAGPREPGGPAAAAPAGPPGPDVVRRDLDLVVGGRFNVDEIGPDAYQEIVDRLRAHPDAYLQAAEDAYLGARFDAVAQSRLHLPRLVELLQDSTPRARQFAADLLRHLQPALVVFDQVESREALAQVVPEETVNMMTRLDDRRRALQILAGRV
jgi:hypothetical protein